MSATKESIAADTPSQETAQASGARGLARNWPWLLLLLYLLPPYILSDFNLYRFTGVTLYVLIAIGYNLITGWGGQFVVISAALVGIGAYVTANLLKHNWPLILAILMAGVVCAVIGALLAALTVQLRGLYLAKMSGGLASAATIVMYNWTSVTGGEIGKLVPNLKINGDKPPTNLELYWVVTSVTILGIISSWILVRGQWGRILKAQARNELAAKSAGINVEGARRAALALGGFYFGIAGGLYALMYGYLSPDSFGLQNAILYLAMIVVGGLGTFIGPVLGAYVIGGIPQFLQFSQAYETILFAVSIFVVVLFIPDGLAAGPKRLFKELRSNLEFFATFGRKRDDQDVEEVGL
jgi:branched-chain amino acid transport system permease protein